MIKRIIVLIIAIVMISSGCIIIAQSQKLDVNITLEDNSISIIESIPFEIISGGILEFWIQDGGNNISVSIGGEPIEYESIGINKYSSNVSSLYGLNEDILDIIVAYRLDQDTNKFEKTLLYNIAYNSKLVKYYDRRDIY